MAVIQLDHILPTCHTDISRESPESGWSCIQSDRLDGFAPLAQRIPRDESIYDHRLQRETPSSERTCRDIGSHDCIKSLIIDCTYFSLHL